jgi:3-hydroxyacyl-CoA dehydrogenase
LGDKSGQGFYKKTDQRDEKGGRVILALDLNTLEYKPAQKVMIPVVGIAKKVEIMDKRLKEMMASDEKSGHFVEILFVGMMLMLLIEFRKSVTISTVIDNAMKAGYAWTYGPFEYWDMIGIAETHCNC